MVALTKQKDYWWKDVWLLLQKMTIDGNMHDCFNKTELRIIDRNMHGCFYKNWLLMGRWMVAFTKIDYWWKDVWLLYKTEGLLMEWWMVAFTKNDYWRKDVLLLLQNRRNIDGMMYGCFTKQKDYWWKDAWLLYKTEGLLMERCKVDGKMYGCFTCRQN